MFGGLGVQGLGGFCIRVFKGKGVLGLGCSRVRNPNLGYLRVRVFKSWGVWGLGYLKLRVFKGKCVQGLRCLGLGCLRIRMFKGKGI